MYLRSPGDGYAISLDEQYYNDRLEFSWSNTYVNVQDSIDDASILWLAVFDTNGNYYNSYGHLAQNHNTFEEDDTLSIMHENLLDYLGSADLDVGLFVWDVVYDEQYDNLDQTAIQMNDYIIYDYSLPSNMHSSNNGPFVIYAEISEDED